MLIAQQVIPEYLKPLARPSPRCCGLYAMYWQRSNDANPTPSGLLPNAQSRAKVAAENCNAIHKANNTPRSRYDSIFLFRGGGSIEDYGSSTKRFVARADADCRNSNNQSGVWPWTDLPFVILCRWLPGSNANSSCWAAVRIVKPLKQKLHFYPAMIGMQFKF